MPEAKKKKKKLVQGLANNMHSIKLTIASFNYNKYNLWYTETDWSISNSQVSEKN